MDECKAWASIHWGRMMNESNLKFTVNKEGNIRFGLGAVKGVGEGAVQSIMEEREKNGPFKGIFDFVQRVNLTACNKKNLDVLLWRAGSTAPGAEARAVFCRKFQERGLPRNLGAVW